MNCGPITVEHPMVLNWAPWRLETVIWLEVSEGPQAVGSGSVPGAGADILEPSARGGTPGTVLAQGGGACPALAESARIWGLTMGHFVLEEVGMEGWVEAGSWWGGRREERGI